MVAIHSIRKSKAVGLWVTVALSLAGCASVLSNGGKQVLSFDSSPQGAVVSINGLTQGRTPVKISVVRQQELKVIFSKPGYKAVAFEPQKQLDGWFLGNILIGGVIGSSTDYSTGSIQKFDQDAYFAILDPIQGEPVKINGVFVLPQGRVAVKQFILLSHELLAAEIAAGAGDHLQALYQQLQVPRDLEAVALNKLRLFLQRHPDPVQFTDAALDFFLPESR